MFDVKTIMNDRNLKLIDTLIKLITILLNVKRIYYSVLYFTRIHIDFELNNEFNMLENYILLKLKRPKKTSCSNQKMATFEVTLTQGIIACYSRLLTFFF